MPGQKILLPYNFTDIDRKALDFIVRTFARQEGNQLSLFHTYTPLPKIETDSSTVMGKLRTSMHYLSEELRKKEADLESARQYLIENGFLPDNVDYIFTERTQDIADEIIKTVVKGSFDVVVLSYKPERVTRFYKKSAHNKVVSSLKSTAICIVT